MRRSCVRVPASPRSKRDQRKCGAHRHRCVRRHRGDATSTADNERAVAAATDAFGGLDALVNCVGIFDFYRGVAELAADAIAPSFDEMFHVNVLSQILGVKAALPALTASGGSIVLTVSTSGFYPGRGGVLYVATKFAVRGLVIAMAHELAPHVRVNGVAPGGTIGTELRGPEALGLDTRSLGDTPGRAEELKARAAACALRRRPCPFVRLPRLRPLAGITGTSSTPTAASGSRRERSGCRPACGRRR